MVNIAFTLSHWLFCFKMAPDLKWKKYKAIGANLGTIRQYQVHNPRQFVAGFPPCLTGLCALLAPDL